MDKNFIARDYFNWMYRLIFDRGHSRCSSYRTLLSYLNNQEFIYSIGMDGNRADDGIELRYRFGRELQYPEAAIASTIDDRPCSVLEMMVALSLRCEDHIMDDPEIGNRTSQWFWDMIFNLGLGAMTDNRFDSMYVNMAIQRFLNHKYTRNGEGGLFTVHRCRQDLRQTEIWYQMCWYLDEILNN